MSTLLISAGVFVLLAGILWKMVKDAKAGKHGCDGNCSHCKGCH